MSPRVAVLGASGVIGHAIAIDLMNRDFAVTAYARRFTPAQKWALRGNAVETPFVTMSPESLAQMFEASGIDVVINCVGVLQDGPGGSTWDVHQRFVEKLAAYCASLPSRLLIHVSVPGDAKDDSTSFSKTKHAAERMITASGAPFVILRPGFVIAPATYGGGAMLRALAMTPVALSPRESNAPFSAVWIGDICQTVTKVIERWRRGERGWRQSWDVMEEAPGSIGDVVELMRARAGGPPAILKLPPWMAALGALVGDGIAWLGWKPPLRTTAILELRRGVRGAPDDWIRETGIRPLSARAALERIPFTIQEKWFARLYLLKPLVLVTLAPFWIVSGLIAPTPSFDRATAILTVHGASLAAAQSITLAASILDILIGCLIAARSSCRVGLIAGIAVSLFYVIGTAIFAPDLWVEPLGPLVKVVPAIVLMLIGLALLDER